mmetsp:Transcript_38544/g.91043  ORF Transcript_38544/g.91043 Transcript_38544/m.91043 type:complete len:204 (+) Transcript_38544:1504-2115(+)
MTMSGGGERTAGSVALAVKDAACFSTLMRAHTKRGSKTTVPGAVGIAFAHAVYCVPACGSFGIIVSTAIVVPVVIAEKSGSQSSARSTCVARPRTFAPSTPRFNTKSCPTTATYSGIGICWFVILPLKSIFGVTSCWQPGPMLSARPKPGWQFCADARPRRNTAAMKHISVAIKPCSRLNWRSNGIAPVRSLLLFTKVFLRDS